MPMSSADGTAVLLCLVTQDNDLERTLADGLDAAGLENDIRRMTLTDAPDQLAGSEIADAASLILLDMRPPNTDARAFLGALQRQSEITPPVVILIADRDEETKGLDAHARMIAGRISSDTPAEDLTRLVDYVLADNWTIEDRS